MRSLVSDRRALDQMKRGLDRIWLFLLAGIIFAAASLPALAQDATGTVDQAMAQRISDLTDALVRQQLDLERYYLGYRLAAIRDPKFSRLRYFLLQQASAGVYIGSNAAQLIDTAKVLHDPSQFSVPALRKAYAAGLIGGVLGGGSSGIEVGANALLAYEHCIHNQSPGYARRYVTARLKEIDQLALEREELVRALPQGSLLELCKTEGTLLKYYRDWCLYEFADFYAQAKSEKTSFNLYYAIDVASETLSAVSYDLSIKGLKQNEKFGPSILVGMVCDSLLIPAAPLSSWTEGVLYKYWFGRLRRQFKDRLDDPKAKADAWLIKLQNIERTADAKTLSLSGSFQDRARAYKTWDDHYQSFLDRETHRLEHLDKVALQQTFLGPVISAADLSADISNTIGFYRDKNSENAQNKLTFEGAIASLSASALNFTATNYYFFDQLKFESHLKKIHAMPDQLIKSRIHTLDIIEELLKHNQDVPLR
jgi:hypothetical protein